jgi:hypothetical protein
VNSKLKTKKEKIQQRLSTIQRKTMKKLMLITLLSIATTGKAMKNDEEMGKTSIEKMTTSANNQRDSVILYIKIEQLPDMLPIELDFSSYDELNSTTLAQLKDTKPVQK